APVGACPAQSEARRDRSAQAPLLEVGDRGGRGLEASLVIRMRRIENLLVPRDLLLAALRGGALGGAAVFFGHRHADGRGQAAHRLGEAGPGVLHQKRNGAAMRSAAEAVVKLLGGTDSEGGTFFVMKRTQAKQVGPALAQLHISPDDVDYIYPGKKLLDKRVW